MSEFLNLGNPQRETPNEDNPRAPASHCPRLHIPKWETRAKARRQLSGRNSWRERELEGAALGLGAAPGPQPRETSGPGARCVRRGARGAPRVCSPRSSRLRRPPPAEASRLTVARLSLVYSLPLNSPNQIFTPNTGNFP